MKNILVIVLCAFTMKAWTQKAEYFETDEPFTTVVINYENLGAPKDSLHLSVSKSSGEGSEEYEGAYVPNFEFNGIEGDIFTVWLTGGEVDKGLFFTIGPDPILFYLDIDVDNKDILQLEWNYEENMYYYYLLDKEKIDAMLNDDVENIIED